MNNFKPYFETSMKENKGAMFYVEGQIISGVVTKVNKDNVELRNREYGKIIILIEKISAIAMS